MITPSPRRRAGTTRSAISATTSSTRVGRRRRRCRRPSSYERRRARSARRARTPSAVVGEQRAVGRPPPTRPASTGTRRPQPHDRGAGRSSRAVAGVEHDARRRRRSRSGRGHPSERRRARRVSSRRNAASPSVLEDLAHRPAGPRLEPARRRRRRALEPASASRRPTVVLPDAHHPDQHDVPGDRLAVVERDAGQRRPTTRRRGVCSRTWSAKPRALRTSSPSESPPNLRVASSASTSATIVSATTPMAGTAVTSVRSLNETVSSLVTMSTVRERRAVERGQRLHRGPGDEQLAGGHAALDAAGQRGRRAR